MEKKYKILLIFFLTVVVISLAGFFNSYIKHLPETGKFPILIHIHFIVFLSWFAMLIAQPILIRQKKYGPHRKIGRLSYFLAPVLVITILWVVKNQTIRKMEASESDAAVTMLIGLLDAVTFSTYYIIAMINKRNLRWHVAFLIAASLIILNPGMSRLLNQIQPGSGLLAAVLFPFVVAALIILYEKIKLKRPVLKSPYFLFFCCWTAEMVLFMALPYTEVWRNFAANLMKGF